FGGVDQLIALLEAGQPVAELISDRYLNQAVGACCTDNERLLLSKDVRQLITRYAPADRPFMSDIPQERRRQFLNELAWTTKRALPPQEPARCEPALAGQDAKLIVNGKEPVPAETALADQDAMPFANGHKPIPGVSALADQDAKLIADGYEPIAV